MTVTKQQQLEWLAKNLDSWHEDGSRVCVVGFDNRYADPYFPCVHPYGITKKEWQQERDKMQKQQNNTWHERGELPPVGCECEVFDGGDWVQSFIVGFSRSGDVVVQTRNGYFEASGANFRPLRTDREKAIDDMKSLCAYPGSWCSTFKAFAESLYDAGYRKEQAK